jgi:hypothetical protein
MLLEPSGTFGELPINKKKKIDAIRDLQSHRNIHKVQSLTGFVAKFRFFYLNKII